MTRAQEALARRNCAANHIANLTPEQRLTLTPERLMDAFGLTEEQARFLLRGIGQ